ncbi:hypothetical protein BH11CYA1_BH11CYA1_28630 [soil metagenome]
MKNEKKASKWVKRILVALIICVISIFTLLAGGAYWIFALTTNSEYLRSAADSFMNISDPLPNGCSYYFGFCPFSRPYIRIRSKDMKTLYTFYEYMDMDNKLSSDIPVQKLVERAASGEVLGAFGSKSHQRMVISKQGTLLVGKQDMPYVIGHKDEPFSTDQVTVNCLMGFLKAPISGKLIVITVENLTGDNVLDKDKPLMPITIERVRSLTDGINSFK